MAKKTKGWLDNYNDYSISAPEGFQGDGFDMTGRNYSPAWGGQFEMGGNIPQAQAGKKINLGPIPYKEKYMGNPVDNTYVALPPVGALKIPTTDVEKYAARKAKETPAQIVPANKPRSAVAEAWVRNAFPMTALKYKMKGQQIPNNFEKGEINPFDQALAVINPFRWAYDFSNAGDDIVQGNYVQSAFDAASILPFLSGAKTVAPGLQLLNQDARAAGNFLTTQTPLQNTYKLNPWAFKANPEAYYRMLGKEGYKEVPKLSTSNSNINLGLFGFGTKKPVISEAAPLSPLEKEALITQENLARANKDAVTFSQSAANKAKLQEFRPNQNFSVSNQQARFIDDPEALKLYESYRLENDPKLSIEQYLGGSRGQYGTRDYGDMNDIVLIDKHQPYTSNVPSKSAYTDAMHETTHSRSIRLGATDSEKKIATDAWSPMIKRNSFGMPEEEAFAVQNELRTDKLKDIKGERIYTEADIPEIKKGLQQMIDDNHEYLQGVNIKDFNMPALIKSLNKIGLGTAVLGFGTAMQQKQMGGSIGGGNLPGATGMMYARHGAPSNGPYAKKTMPSAQSGIKKYKLTDKNNKDNQYPVDTNDIKKVVSTAIGMGYDPKLALAVALQESGLGRTDSNYFHVLKENENWGKVLPEELGIQMLKEKKKLANKLGYTNPEMELQTYNGLGKIFPTTEQNYHGFKMKKIYGVPIPESGLDLRKNPLYGKRVLGLKDSVIENDPKVNEIINYYQNFYKNPESVYYTKSSDLTPVVVTPQNNAQNIPTWTDLFEKKNGGLVPIAQDGSQIDPIAQEMKSYVESPLYLQRLKGMGVNDPELLQQSRANNLKNVTFATGPSDNTNVDSHGWPLVTLKPGSSEYTKAHELGHAISSYGGITNVSSMTEAGSNQMSPREAWYIMNRNVNTAKTPYQINPLASEKNKTVRENAWDLQHDDKNKLYSSISPFPNSGPLEGIDITSQYHGKLDPHDVNAGENYGDLTALRHALLKQGYTKSFGENLSQETLNKAFQDQKIKNIKQVQRMRRNFNDASILDINNKIAYQDNSQGDVFARDGASVYYQYGLDFTPKSMKNGGEMIKRADGSYSRRGLWDNIRANIGSKKKPTKEMLKQEKKIKAKSKQDGGPIPVDPLGYWNPDNVGNPVIIPSTDITMKGVDQDLIGVSNTGDVKRMKKGKNYKFDGDYVTEYPTMKYGGELTKLDQLTNFTNYNTKQPGGWLDKYK